jgi:hypothetical protein
MMFQVEIQFDAASGNLAELCSATDEIFGKYSLPCVVREEGGRVYMDSGDKADYGKLWAAVDKVRHTPQIVGAIKDGYWVNGEKRESLMDNFFKV